MFSGIGRCAGSWALVIGCAASLACGASAPQAPVAVAPVAAAPVAAAPGVEPAPAAVEPAAAATAAPVESPGFAEALTKLRPAGAEPARAAVQAKPEDAQLYAQAAMAYATTDAPVMTLIWGMMYLAMGGGASEPQVGQAFVQVLSERVVIGNDADGRVSYNVRLAPGQMPTREHPDGSLEAPLAHAFEGMFGATLLGFQPPWSVEEVYDVLSSWAGVVATRGTPLDELLELDGWLVTLAKAGHLEAYCFRLVGAAFPAELKAYKAAHAKELKALDEYLKSAALKPKRAVMPDDLVRLK